MLKKYFENYLIIWVIFVAIFLAVCFLTPNTLEGYNKFGGAFWGPFVIIMISLIGELFVAKKVFDSETKEQLFLNLPLYRLCYLGTALTFIVGTICMMIPDLPNWVGSVICGIILVLTYMSLSLGQGVSARIQDKEAALKASTANMRDIVSKAKLLLDQAPENQKESFQKVYDALRYSDVVSSSESHALEKEIERTLNTFAENNSDETLAKLISLINERNELVQKNK